MNTGSDYYFDRTAFAGITSAISRTEFSGGTDTAELGEALGAEMNLVTFKAANSRSD
jgi:hypothetical protein